MKIQLHNWYITFGGPAWSYACTLVANSVSMRPCGPRLIDYVDFLVVYLASVAPSIFLPSHIPPSFVSAYFCHWWGGFRKDCFSKFSVQETRNITLNMDWNKHSKVLRHWNFVVHCCCATIYVLTLLCCYLVISIYWGVIYSVVKCPNTDLNISESRSYIFTLKL